MQRLFSTFADGWPGVGLLLLRAVTGVALIHFGVANLRAAPPLMTIVLQVIGILAVLLLLVGLWTPIAGALVAVVKALMAASCFLWHSGDPHCDPWICIILFFLGAALAMLGPGAWSIDARLFGRKHINFPEC